MTPQTQLQERPISASSTDRFDSCALSWWAHYRANQPDGPPSPPALIGLVSHEAYEILGRRWLESGPFVVDADAAERATFEAAERRCADPEAHDPTREILLEVIKNTRGGAPFLRLKNIHAVEEQFNVELPEGGSVLGFFDRVDLLTNGNIVRVEDYKFGNLIPTRSELATKTQTLYYLMAAKEKYPERTPEIVFWYVKKNIRMTFRWDEVVDSMARATAAGVLKRIARMDSERPDGDWPASPGIACRWCDCRETCDARRVWEEESADLAISTGDFTTYPNERLVVERRRLSDLAALAEVRRRAMDEVLRSRLLASGEPIHVGDFTARIVAKRRKQYPSVGETAAALVGAIGGDFGVISTEIAAVAGKAVDAYLRGLGKDDRTKAESALEQVINFEGSPFVEVRQVKRPI